MPVHPLILLTFASLLLVLFGVTSLVMSRGRARSDVERTAGAGVPGLKRLIEAGEWRGALPALLVTTGMIGLMVFGALTLAVVFGQRATGILMLAVAGFALLRIVREYRRA